MSSLVLVHETAHSGSSYIHQADRRNRSILYFQSSWVAVTSTRGLPPQHSATRHIMVRSDDTHWQRACRGWPRVRRSDIPALWLVTDDVVASMRETSGPDPAGFHLVVDTAIEVPGSMLTVVWKHLQSEDPACVPILVMPPDAFDTARGQGAAEACWRTLADGSIPQYFIHTAGFFRD
jgi:hypothetical protein